MHAAGAQSNPRVAPLRSAFFGALRPWRFRLETGDLYAYVKRARKFLSDSASYWVEASIAGKEIAACCTGKNPAAEPTRSNSLSALVRADAERVALGQERFDRSRID